MPLRVGLELAYVMCCFRNFRNFTNFITLKNTLTLYCDNGVGEKNDGVGDGDGDIILQRRFFQLPLHHGGAVAKASGARDPKPFLEDF